MEFLLLTLVICRGGRGAPRGSETRRGEGGGGGHMSPSPISVFGTAVTGVPHVAIIG